MSLVTYPVTAIGSNCHAVFVNKLKWCADALGCFSCCYIIFGLKKLAAVDH